MAQPALTAAASPNPKERTVTFILLTFLSFLATVGEVILPPLVIPMQEAFRVGSDEIGLLMTVFFLTSATSQFWVGLFAGVFQRPGPLLLAVGFILAAASALFSLTSNYYLAVMWVGALGVAHGFQHNLGYALTARLYPGEHRGRALGFHNLSTSFASTLTPVLVLAAMRAGDWRLAFQVLAVVALVTVGILYARLGSMQFGGDGFDTPEGGGALKGTPSPQAREGGLAALRESAAAFRKCIGRPPVRRTFILACVVLFAWWGFKGFIPAFLVEAKGVSLEVANSMFAVVFLAAFVSKPMGGWLADRMQPTKAIFLCIGIGFLSALLMLAIPSSPSLGLLSVIMVLVGFGIPAYFPPLYAHVLGLLPGEAKELGWGAFLSLTTFAGGLGPIASGWLIRSFGMWTAFAVLTVIMGITVVMAGWDRYREGAGSRGARREGL